MEVRRLIYFARIAEDGSLTKAAGVLRIAQPALSRQMRLLEEELGVTLFTRTARGMRLTEEGAYLHAAASGPLRALELALQNVRSFSTHITGNFAIGMSSSVGDVLARELALRMNAQFPDIKLRLVEGTTGSLIEWLNRGIIDFALLEQNSEDDRLSDVLLFSDDLVLVGPTNSPLDANSPVSFRKVMQLPLIIPSHHLGIRETVSDAAAKTRTTWSPEFEADSSKLIKELVASGIGYAILPRLFASDELLAGTLNHWPITSPNLSFKIYISSRAHNTAETSRVEETVVDTIRSIFNQLEPRICGQFIQT